MANTLEYLLKLNAGAFDGPMKAATASTNNFSASADKAAAKLDGLRTSASSVGQGFSGLFDKAAHLGSNIANVVAGVQAAHKAFTWLRGSTEATSNVASNAAVSVSNVAASATRLSSGARLAGGAMGFMGVAAGGAVLGIAAVTAAVAAFAVTIAPIIAIVAAVKLAFTALSSSVTAGAKFESTSVAFENLIGDANLAKQTLQGLVNFASQTPFELPEVQKAAQTLLGAGVAADKLNGSLNSLGNVTSAFQADLSTVATIFAQVVNKGQLYAEEIQQFGENGIPALQLLSESMGKTKAEIIAAATAGELTASDLAAAFDKAGSAGGKFANAMQRQSQTTAGLWSTFKDSIGQIFRTLGGPVNDMIRPMLRAAISLADKFGSALSTAITIARNAVAQGQLGAAISNALTLGAKLGLNALIDGFAALPGKVLPFIVSIGQAIKAGLTGGWEEAKAILERSKFNLGGNMRFDTSSEEAFFKKLMGDAQKATAAGAAGGGLADAVGKVTPKEKAEKEKAGKEKGEAEEKGRHKIMGYKPAQWATNPGTDQRSFGQFFSKERSQRLTPEWQNFFHGVPMPGVEQPSRVTRRQQEKAAAEAAAKAATPRWDLVEKISNKLTEMTAE